MILALEEIRNEAGTSVPDSYELAPGISVEDLRCARRMYAETTVVMSIAMMDALVADVTRLLFLRSPGSIPANKQVKVSELLARSSYSEVLELIVDTYVFELGYAKISDRLSGLGKTFGIDLTGCRKEIERLQEHWNLRNLLLHDASSYRYGATDQRGRARVEERKDVPEVTWEAAENVYATCEEVALALVSAITEPVLGVRLQAAATGGTERWRTLLGELQSLCDGRSQKGTP